MALIPPFMLDCVVAIGFADASGTVSYAGTGFLFGRFISKVEGSDQSRYRVFLVTNRHVVAGESTAFLRFNPEAASPAQVFDAPLLDGGGKPTWTGHPDPAIDIAVLGINVTLLNERRIQYKFFCGDKHLMNQQDAIEEGVSEGDGVFVLGFPMGNVGAERNYVVVRQGAIARIRDALAGAVPEFLIDATVFPGNSGGPVLMRPEITAIDGTKSLNKSALIGVVSSYLPYRDVAVSQQTRRPRIIFEENSGLTSVVPIDRVVEAVEIAFAAGPAPTPEPSPAQA
jgi:S1-C subfamily serine protease